MTIKKEATVKTVSKAAKSYPVQAPELLSVETKDIIQAYKETLPKPYTVTDTEVKGLLKVLSGSEQVSNLTSYLYAGKGSRDLDDVQRFLKGKRIPSQAIHFDKMKIHTSPKLFAEAISSGEWEINTASSMPFAIKRIQGISEKELKAYLEEYHADKFKSDTAVMLDIALVTEFVMTERKSRQAHNDKKLAEFELLTLQNEIASLL